jgi:hypothetical protein
MYERCSFLGYEVIDEILEQPNFPYIKAQAHKLARLSMPRK